MTVQELILGYPGLEGVSPGLISKVSIDREVNLAVDYDPSLSTKVNLVIANLLVSVVNSTDYTENKLSERFARKYMLGTASRLYRTNGEPERAKELLKSDFNVIGRAPNRW